MDRSAYLFRCAVVAGLGVSLVLAAALPGGAVILLTPAKAAHSASPVEPAARSQCCCGTPDAACCGTSCCGKTAPRQAPSPSQGETERGRDFSTNLATLGPAAAASFSDGGLAACGISFAGHDASESRTLQGRHVRLQI